MYYILIISDPPVDSVLVAGPVRNAVAGRHLPPVDGHATPDLKHARRITVGVVKCDNAAEISLPDHHGLGN